MPKLIWVLSISSFKKGKLNILRRRCVVFMESGQNILRLSSSDIWKVWGHLFQITNKHLTQIFTTTLFFSNIKWATSSQCSRQHVRTCSFLGRRVRLRGWRRQGRTSPSPPSWPYPYRTRPYPTHNHHRHQHHHPLWHHYHYYPLD